MPTRTRAALLAAGLFAVPPVFSNHAVAQPAQETAQPSISVVEPWSRAMREGGVGAVFLTLRNSGTEPDRLLSVSAPIAKAAELHATIRDGDVMRMRSVQAVEVPAGGTVELRPGGLHIMLVGLSQPLTQGASVPLTLTFERAGPVTVQVAIQAAGAPMHGSGAMHGGPMR